MKQIQFITHQNHRYSYVDSARMALEGGCRWIQLRMKDATDDEVRKAASGIQPLCREHEAVFIIDDRVELAKELKADGVHLGRNDMPVCKARRVLGEEFVIGGTANTFDDVERLWREGADYIGCGPFQRFMLMKRNWSKYVDRLRDDLWEQHPEIQIVDFSFYNLEVFNQCEHENALLMAVPQWEGVHPLLKILPVEWNHSIPFGLLHSPTPSPTVQRLIHAVAQVMNAKL